LGGYAGADGRLTTHKASRLLTQGRSLMHKAQDRFMGASWSTVRPHCRQAPAPRPLRYVQPCARVYPLTSARSVSSPISTMGFFKREPASRLERG
jgi:hypothetical protein